MLTRRPLPYLILLAAWGCSDGAEAPRFDVPVVVDRSGVEVANNDLGWQVTLSEARVVLANLEMTSEGEMHASLWRRVSDMIIPSAHAHPGHLAGGEVIGELPGRFVFHWIADHGRELGQARMLGGRYQGVNFSFGEEGAAPFAGATFFLAGTARKDSATVTFSVGVALDTSVKMVGAPFSMELDGQAAPRIALQLLTVVPNEGKTLFDLLDFAALDDDGDGQLVIARDSPAHHILRRNLQSHDHYRALELRGE